MLIHICIIHYSLILGSILLLLIVSEGLEDVPLAETHVHHKLKVCFKEFTEVIIVISDRDMWDVVYIY